MLTTVEMMTELISIVPFLSWVIDLYLSSSSAETTTEVTINGLYCVEDLPFNNFGSDNIRVQVDEVRMNLTYIKQQLSVGDIVYMRIKEINREVKRKLLDLYPRNLKDVPFGLFTLDKINWKQFVFVQL